MKEVYVAVGEEEIFLELAFNNRFTIYIYACFIIK